MSDDRMNVGRDATAVVLLLVALVLPWNLHLGVTVPHSNWIVIVLLAAATALSLAAVAATYAGPWRASDHALALLRPALNAPYVALVVAFVIFNIVQTVKFGGTANVPPGVGPGAWLGIAGCLLAAAPTIEARGWSMSARTVGYLSMLVATFFAVFHVYHLTKFVFSGSGLGEGWGATVATTLVYSAVALATVIVASRWIVQDIKPSRLATVALGASTLVAGVVVWSLPVGFEIDAFHGIAQNTARAGVGFEGYLAWAAAAAIFASVALPDGLSANSAARGVRREAARKCLLLIAVWCAGSAAMRVTDLIVAATLNIPHTTYDSAVLIGFDVLTAVIAVLLRPNLANRALPVRLISAVCAILFAFTVCRVVVGVILAPPWQQITSTFDVVLCGLALCVVAVGVLTRRAAQPQPVSRAPTGPPRIYQPDDEPAQQRHGARVLEESTRRFAAGTTYGGPTGRNRIPGDAPPND